MATNMSTGFRARILGAESFDDILGGGCVKVFTGAQPASADAPEQGTLLGLVTLNGLPWTTADTTNGLHWLRTGTFMGIPSSAAWRLLGNAAGNAGWFRIVGPSADAGGTSATAPRIDGSIGVTATPGDMTWGSVAVLASNSYAITSLFFVLPPLSA
jgi:hypothetical protein